MVSISSTGEETFFTKSFFPTFLVRELLPSTSYTVKVWASNANGNSEPNYVTTTTLNVPDIAERKLKESEKENPLLWLFVFIGLTCTVIIFVIIVMSLKMCRHDSLVTSDSAGQNMFHQIDAGRTEKRTSVIPKQGVHNHDDLTSNISNDVFGRAHNKLKQVNKVL